MSTAISTFLRPRRAPHRFRPGTRIQTWLFGVQGGGRRIIRNHVVAGARGRDSGRAIPARIRLRLRYQSAAETSRYPRDARRRTRGENPALARTQARFKIQQNARHGTAWRLVETRSREYLSPFRSRVGFTVRKAPDSATPSKILHLTAFVRVTFGRHR